MSSLASTGHPDTVTPKQLESYPGPAICKTLFTHGTLSRSPRNQIGMRALGTFPEGGKIFFFSETGSHITQAGLNLLQTMALNS